MFALRSTNARSSPRLRLTELVDKPTPGVYSFFSPRSPKQFCEGKLSMTSEMTGKYYQAVRCFQCSKPIPLSTRLLELCHFDSGSTPAELEGQCQVFILRCDACSKESRYLKTEIETFEEDPPHRGDVNPSVPLNYPKSLRRAAGQ
jgi:hypothetical protein